MSQLNKAGIDLIKSFESCRLVSYPDPATGGAPYTIGWGCTGPDITETTVWTQAEADSELNKRLSILTSQIDSMLQTELTDNQFSACVSLAYNIGIGDFERSTLLKLLNAGRSTRTASLEFPKWDKANGKEIPGLLRRRLAEQKLFNT